MRSFINSRVCCMIGVLVGALVSTLVAFMSVFAVEANAQSLFSQPDTSPNFASYRFLEECEVAALRIADELVVRKNPVWEDTMSAEMQDNYMVQRAMSRRPDTAIQAASVCLQRFTPDTVTIHGLGYAEYILHVLLIAHRDEDARRFVQRVFDSVRRQSEWKLRDALAMVMDRYGKAQPVRLESARRTYAELLDVLKDDSLKYTVYAAERMAGIAGYAGDTALYREAAWHAIRTVDAIPAKEHRRQFDDIYLSILASHLRKLTVEEGLDSLAISTTAYHMWLANAVDARIFGDEWRKLSTDNVQDTIPDLVGAHYYVASDTSQGAATYMASPGLAAYSARGAVPRGEIPVRGHVNVILNLPSFCHAEGRYREVDFRHRVPIRTARACAREYATLRRLKQRVPELEITILGETYGTVGQLGPLTPAEEADTLAKLWLGWHHIPARLVVEETPFFHVAEPDGRRVDFPTAFEDSLARMRKPWRKPWIKLADQDGVAVELIDRFRYRFDAQENVRLIEAMLRRGRK